MKKAGIAACLLALSFQVYADESPQVDQGAANLDWQSCVNAKKSDCINDCASSEDVDCSDNCDQLAKDKCQAAGLTPPG